MSIITIRCRLAANEDTRRQLWQLMTEKNTPLINELLHLVSLHPEFEAWQQKGTLSKEAVKQICKTLKQNPRFAGQPGRFYTSAEEIVYQTYEAWLASHREKQALLDKKKQWLEIIKRDLEFAEICDVSLEAMQAKSNEILNLVSASSSTTAPSKQPRKTQRGKRSKKTKQSQEVAFARDKLFVLLSEAEDPLSYRTIVHLLKHNCQVGEQEETLEKLAEAVTRKSKEIQRLENQLKARTPRGRATTEQEIEGRIAQAIDLPEHPSFISSFYFSLALLCSPLTSLENTQFIFACLLKSACSFKEDTVYPEFLDWEENFAAKHINLVRGFKSLPYPILYSSQDVTTWSRNERGRISLSFNGLARNHLFEVQCDRRQLPLFELFLEDWKTLHAKENDGQYSGSFLLLREARLLWQEPKLKLKPKKKKIGLLTRSQSECLDDGLSQKNDIHGTVPWNRLRLELHCTVDTQRLTIQGTEKFRQEELASRSKELERRSTRSNFEQNPEKSMYREQVKQTTLHNSKHFRRSQKPLYQGDPDKVLGVSFNLAAPATVAVVQGSTNETLMFCSSRQLLGENYRLLNRQRQEQSTHDQQRSKHQRKDKFEQPSESELGLYIDRLFAKKIIAIAKRYQVGSIVIPALKGLRERIQSEVEARAECKIPGSREAQNLYAKQYRKQIHKWSYSRLAQNIQSQAAKVGIPVEIENQPLQGSPQQKARDLAIAAYHARKISS